MVEFGYTFLQILSLLQDWYTFQTQSVFSDENKTKPMKIITYHKERYREK